MIYGHVSVFFIASYRPATKVVLIQRWSFGYAWPSPLSLSIEDIGRIITSVKAVRADVVCVMVNYYHEFLKAVELVHVMVDAVRDG